MKHSRRPPRFSLPIALVLLLAVWTAGCASRYQRLVEDGRRLEAAGRWEGALSAYRDACSLHPDTAVCREKVPMLAYVVETRKKELRPEAPAPDPLSDAASGPAAGAPHAAPAPATPPRVDEPSPEGVRFAHHQIRPGDTLSRIALSYYDTYKTPVHYLPDRERFVDGRGKTAPGVRRIKVGNVAEVLAAVNDVRPESLSVGDRLKLPEIEGLPFILPPASESWETVGRAMRTRLAAPRPKPRPKAPPPPPEAPEPRAVSGVVDGFIPQPSPEERSRPRAITEEDLMARPVPEPEPPSAESSAGGPAEDSESSPISPDGESPPQAADTTRRSAAATPEPASEPPRELPAEPRARPTEAAPGPEPEREELPPAVEMAVESGISAFNRGDYPGAIADLERVVARDGSNQQAMAYLCRAHYNLALARFKSDYDAARAHLASARRLRSTCRPCIRAEERLKERQYRKGIEHFDQGEILRAIQAWEPVEFIDPGYKEVRSHLSTAYQLLNTNSE